MAEPTNPAQDSKPHRPADDREEVYFEGTPLLRADVAKMALWALVAAVLIAIPIIWRNRQGAFPNVWVTSAMWAGAALCLLVPWLVARTTRYRVSNYRIDFERGLLSKRIDTLELWHVEDINLVQSVLDRIFKVGTITILSDDDTTPKLELSGIPNARGVFEALKQRIIAVKRQRGVIKLDN